MEVTTLQNNVPASPLLKPVVIRPSAPPVKQKGVIIGKKAKESSPTRRGERAGSGKRRDAVSTGQK